MGTITLAHGGQTFASYGTDWLYLFVPIAVLIAVATGLVWTGTAPTRGNIVATLFRRAGASLERVTGYPAWSSGGVALAIWALVVAVIGFLWDVAWHMDQGRDNFLFTPAHTMILVGLGGILAAGVLSAIFASLGTDDVGRRIGPIKVPNGAIGLLALGFGALLGFPLDELWHAAYGIDVTMWGPTHLIMISGASFAPLAIWTLLAEGVGHSAPGGAVTRRSPRWHKQVMGTLAGAVLVGLSTFQAEFDFGVPQFQQLYHPVLIAGACGFGLVLAQVALGPWGALRALQGFLIIRALLAVLVGPILNQTIPRFPLYIASALVVEVAARWARNKTPFAFALASGAGIGTIGLGAEWAWTQVWGTHPWTTALLPGIAIAVVMAGVAAVLGLATGHVLSGKPAGIRPAALVATGAAFVLCLTVPLPRHDAEVVATIESERVSAGWVNVELTMQPAAAADDPDWLNVLTWQGGGTQRTTFEEVSPGRYATTEAIPVGGTWKSIIRLARRDVLVAAPIYMPADAEIDAPEVPVVPLRTAPLDRDTKVLMREAHEGPSWPARVAYGSILLIALGWITALVHGLIALSRDNGSGGPGLPSEASARPASRPHPVSA
ncbi:MAG TPA: hypothetical protein VNC78_01620 [Actinomycetota bacterium]|nr:hypothetical protein [Actinomycetota bacterium]